MTHLADILKLNMIPSLQLRTDHGHLFQDLQQLVANVRQRLDCVTNRGDGGYKACEQSNNTTSVINIYYLPMNRLALSWCRGVVKRGDKTTVISGSINDVSNESFQMA